MPLIGFFFYNKSNKLYFILFFMRQKSQNPDERLEKFTFMALGILQIRDCESKAL